MKDLNQILQELNTTYDPFKSNINAQMAALDPQQQAEVQGLDAAKRDSFDQITTQANRRGMFYSGAPIAEEQRYLGAQYLPAVANLKSRYAQQKFNLQDALNQVNLDQAKYAQQLYNEELSRASGGGGGGSSGGGYYPGADTTQNQLAVESAPQLTLRQQWQQEASAGDWNAQVALNYAGDNGRYDGPVNSKAEYDILKSMGITGNYYLAGQSSGGGGW